MIRTQNVSPIRASGDCVKEATRVEYSLRMEVVSDSSGETTTRTAVKAKASVQA
jgi:hypothetical protein